MQGMILEKMANWSICMYVLISLCNPSYDAWEY